MKLLLRLYPRAWRDRYGDEIDDLLMSSPRPILKRLGLMFGALSVHFERMVAAAARSRVRIMVLGAVSVLLFGSGTAATVQAVAKLRHGIIEVPGHWWSALASAPLWVGVAVAVVVLCAYRRQSRLAG